MPRTSSTRDDLLNAAQEQFGTRGVQATSIRDLARAVGIKESSVYKHFRSKQAIWEALLERTSSRFEDAAARLGIEPTDAAAAVDSYREITPDQLVVIAEALFEFHVHDPSSVAFRRVLTLEQFRDPRAGEMLRRRFVEEPLAFQTTLFGRLLGLPRADAQRLALAFWGPIYLLLDLAAVDEPHARELLTRHVHDFATRLAQTHPTQVAP